MIERVHAASAEMFEHLRVASEVEGFRHVGRLIDDWVSGANRFARPGEALFVARVEGGLVGVGGLNIDSHAADAAIGRVRRLYVLPEYRARGIATSLVDAIVSAARGTFTRLHVRTNNPAADRSYLRLGFVRVVVDDHTHELTLSRADQFPCANTWNVCASKPQSRPAW